MKTFRIVALVLVVGVFACLVAGCSDKTIDSTINKDGLPISAEKQLVNPFTGLVDDGYSQNARPIAIMINNHRLALPQTGIETADITYEIVTEGGITRLMVVYSDIEKVDVVGPVRSQRDQHLQFAMPYRPAFVHIGASKIAVKMFEDLAYTDSVIDGTFGTVREKMFYLDKERRKNRAMEHCFFTTKQMIKDGMTEYNVENTVREPIKPIFDFATEERVLSGGDADEIKWEYCLAYPTQFKYNKDKGKYEKYQFNQAIFDAQTHNTVSYNNVLVLFTNITYYDQTVLSKVELSFGGYGYYLNGGKYEKVRWLKGGANEPLRIVDADGTETDVKINPGNTYITVVGLSQYSTFEINGQPL